MLSAAAQPDYAALPMSAQADRARHLAIVAHTGHFNDKNGEAYILHPTRVAGHAEQIASAAGLAEADFYLVVAAAWLHDTIEDTPVTASMLLALGFPARLVELVVLLTFTDDMSREDYYAALAADPLARLVKLADLADNTDPDRLAALDAFAQWRLCRKYAKAYAALGAQAPDHVRDMIAA